MLNFNCSFSIDKIPKTVEIETKKGTKAIVPFTEDLFIPMVETAIQQHSWRGKPRINEIQCNKQTRSAVVSIEYAEDCNDNKLDGYKEVFRHCLEVYLKADVVISE